MKFILDAIKNSDEKRISFRDFMELALYDSDEGYYIKKSKKIGKEGDFYTSSMVHPIFAKVFTSFFYLQCSINGVKPIICEIGGGNGQFAKNVLDEWRARYPESYSDLTYLIIETSPYHQKEIIKNLEAHSCIQVYSSIQDIMKKIPVMQGIIFSNELLDAFPVHLVKKMDNKLYEIFVAIDDKGKLTEVPIRCQNSKIYHWIKQYQIDLKNEQRFEIPLMMMDWLHDISNWLQNGLLVTIDYGYKKDEWKEDIHRDGSIRGYYKHQLISDPLQYPGEMDLTTHIQIDPLIEYGIQQDLNCLYVDSQLEFLLKAGILTYLKENFDPNPFSEISRMNRAIRTFLTPGGISSAFHVIIQGKGRGQLKWSE